jgi:carbon starvation protein CstA
MDRNKRFSVFVWGIVPATSGIALMLGIGALVISVFAPVITAMGGQPWYDFYAGATVACALLVGISLYREGAWARKELIEEWDPGL